MAVDLTNLRNQLLESAERRVRRATEMMTDDLKRTAPVVTGEMQRKTGVEVTSVTPQRITAEARSDVPYAEYVTMGTRPHVIVPKRPGGVLRFQVMGETVFAKRVNHPGTEANDFYDVVVNNWDRYLRNAG